MSSYLASSDNRFYAAVEAAYGIAASVSGQDRIAASKLELRQTAETPTRRDKTGSRTHAGSATALRRSTDFRLVSELTSLSPQGLPYCGSLVEAAFGCPAVGNSGIVVEDNSSSQALRTSTPHGLKTGDGISYAGEIRFITAAPTPLMVDLNAPFSAPVPPQAMLTATATYKLGRTLPSVSVYDYWSNVTRLHRVVTGAAVDTLAIVIGESPQLIFGGTAADIVNGASFIPGTAGLAEFPQEPLTPGFDYSAVAAHLGQVWLGSTAIRSYTLTDAVVRLRNRLRLRDAEFGNNMARCIVPGARTVETGFNLLVEDDALTGALYQTATARETISVAFQIGQGRAQTMGIYLPAVTPEVPIYDDSGERLAWRFSNSLGQGSVDDEIYIAFA